MIKVKFKYSGLLFTLGMAIAIFNSCRSTKIDSLYQDKGVVINGVKWATRNVDAPGTFAANPYNAGMFYQWNRKKGWATTGDVTDWDSNNFVGDTWEEANDPSPAGWRVPTMSELGKLFDENKVNFEWITVSGISGMRIIDKATSNSIFLPAVNHRGGNDGTLYDAGSGYYWSSTQSTQREDEDYIALFMYFGSDFAYVGYWYGKSSGFSVRSVAK